MSAEEEYKPVLTRKNRLELFEFQECEEILKSLLADTQTEGILKSFEIVPATENTGFLGEYFHLKVTYQLENVEEERTARLFVKSVIYQNANMAFYMEKMQFLKKEAMLYNKLLNELKTLSPHVWCAKCYYTRDDLFVMQNIEDLGYVAVPEETRFLNESQLRPILKALATLHASSMAYERKHKLTIGVELGECLKEMTVDPDVTWWTIGIKTVLAVAAMHPMVLEDPQAQSYIANELPRLLDNVYYMVNSSPLHRNVFCHRDVWSGNVFYHKLRPETEGCVLVDFQLCRYSPPAIDFLMACFLNVEPKERQEMQQRCILHYHDSLRAELLAMGIDIELELNRKDFEQSLKDFALFGATYNCAAATILRLPNNYLKKLKETQPADFHRFCNVDRRPEVLRLISEHDEFRRYMYDCVADLLQLTYYNKDIL
ncbi:uncharacterized protein LOC115630747 [Scaptodrosophila lebanonensis]|uniref:Uncharacterized protein LOC115630747 n=1 Tax=Drosophila lebanonensis TaxID=7225 RepID=A0A6J2U3Q0_DROLE|nr:uncharacterized protein LOC115630747 [Scaptodrosophila lebanonensis]